MQKHYKMQVLFPKLLPLQGVILLPSSTQGAALGYELVGLTGRLYPKGSTAMLLPKNKERAS